MHYWRLFCICFFLDFSAATDEIVKNYCTGDSLAIDLIAEVSARPGTSLSVIIKHGTANTLFLCIAENSLATQQFSISCRAVDPGTIDEQWGNTDFVKTAKLEREIIGIQVSEGHFSTFLLVVLKDARPVLFAVDYIGAKLKFTKLIKSGAIGSSTTSVVQRGDRGAVIFSSSRICSTGPRQNCNIPPVEIVSRYDVKKCGSPKLGTSVATTGWAYGGDLYVLHALNDPKDKSKSYLTLFRVDEQGEHPNCELDLVNLLPLMVAFCDVKSLNFFFSNGLHFVLIASDECGHTKVTGDGSTRNLLLVQWNPTSGLLEKESLIEVHQVVALSASLFAVTRGRKGTRIYSISAASKSEQSADTVADGSVKLKLIVQFPGLKTPEQISVNNVGYGHIYLGRTASFADGTSVVVNRLACKTSSQWTVEGEDLVRALLPYDDVFDSALYSSHQLPASSEKYGYNEEIYQNLSRSGSYKSRYPPVYPVYNHSRGLLKPRNEDGSPISSGQLMLNEYRAQRELYLDHLYQNLTETGSHVSRHLPNYPSYNLSKSSAVKIGHVKPSILKRLPKTPEGVPQNPRQQYLVRPPSAYVHAAIPPVPHDKLSVGYHPQKNVSGSEDKLDHYNPPPSRTSADPPLNVQRLRFPDGYDAGDYSANILEQQLSVQNPVILRQNYSNHAVSAARPQTVQTDFELVNLPTLEVETDPSVYLRNPLTAVRLRPAFRRNLTELLEDEEGFSYKLGNAETSDPAALGQPTPDDLSLPRKVHSSINNHSMLALGQNSTRQERLNTLQSNVRRLRFPEGSESNYLSSVHYEDPVPTNLSHASQKNNSALRRDSFLGLTLMSKPVAVILQPRFPVLFGSGTPSSGSLSNRPIGQEFSHSRPKIFDDLDILEESNQMRNFGRKSSVSRLLFNASQSDSEEKIADVPRVLYSNTSDGQISDNADIFMTTDEEAFNLGRLRFNETHSDDGYHDMEYRREWNAPAYPDIQYRLTVSAPSRRLHFFNGTAEPVDGPPEAMDFDHVYVHNSSLNQQLVNSWRTEGSGPEESLHLETPTSRESLNMANQSKEAEGYGETLPTALVIGISQEQLDMNGADGRSQWPNSADFGTTQRNVNSTFGDRPFRSQPAFLERYNESLERKDNIYHRFTFRDHPTADVVKQEKHNESIIGNNATRFWAQTVLPSAYGELLAEISEIDDSLEQAASQETSTVAPMDYWDMRPTGKISNFSMNGNRSHRIKYQDGHGSINFGGSQNHLVRDGGFMVPVPSNLSGASSFRSNPAWNPHRLNGTVDEYPVHDSSLDPGKVHYHDMVSLNDYDDSAENDGISDGTYYNDMDDGAPSVTFNRSGTRKILRWSNQIPKGVAGGMYSATNPSKNETVHMSQKLLPQRTLQLKTLQTAKHRVHYIRDLAENDHGYAAKPSASSYLPLRSADGPVPNNHQAVPVEHWLTPDKLQDRPLAENRVQDNQKRFPVQHPLSPVTVPTSQLSDLFLPPQQVNSSIANKDWLAQGPRYLDKLSLPRPGTLYVEGQPRTNFSVPAKSVHNAYAKPTTVHDLIPHMAVENTKGHGEKQIANGRSPSLPPRLRYDSGWDSGEDRQATFPSSTRKPGIFLNVQKKKTEKGTLLENVINIQLDGTNSSSNIIDTVLVNMTSNGAFDDEGKPALKLKLVKFSKRISGPAACKNEAELKDQEIVREMDCNRDIRRIPTPIEVRGGSGSFTFEIRNDHGRGYSTMFNVDRFTGKLFPAVPMGRAESSSRSTVLVANKKYPVVIRVTDDVCDKYKDFVVAVIFRCRARQRR